MTRGPEEVRKGPSTDRDGSWCRHYVRSEELGLFRRHGSELPFDYSDGREAEERLLAVVRGATDLSDGSPELASFVRDWPTLYHLGARRANLLRPLAALLKGDVLEVGAGCGALSRFLGENGGSIVALEPSLRRATIAAARCRGLANVAVVADRLEEFPGGAAFDAITLIGVLEYARRFSTLADPVQALLEAVRGRLRPGGVLVLAIENQLGLKYLAGYPEDHVGQPLFGVNDLYGADTAVTFGRIELTARLAAAGFANTELFVPLPDYKVPTSVVTPVGLRDAGCRTVLASLAADSASADPQAPGVPLFSLPMAWPVAVRNGLLPDLANSFLLVARPGPPAEPEPGLLAVHYTSDRRSPFRTETRIVREGSGVSVRRRLLSPTVPAARSGSMVRHRPVDEELVEGRLVAEDVVRAGSRRGWTLDDLAAPFAAWFARLSLEAGVASPASVRDLVAGRFLDATPFNLVRRSDGSLRFIDQEWTAPEEIELGWLVFRALFHTVSSLAAVAEPSPGTPTQVVEIVREIAERLGLTFADQDAARYAVREAALQAEIAGGTAAEIESAIRSRTLRPVPDVSAVIAGYGRAKALETLTADLDARIAFLAPRSERTERAERALEAARTEADEQGTRVRALEASLAAASEEKSRLEKLLAEEHARATAEAARLAAELQRSALAERDGRREIQAARRRVAQLTTSLERGAEELERERTRASELEERWQAAIREAASLSAGRDALSTELEREAHARHEAERLLAEQRVRAGTLDAALAERSSAVAALSAEARTSAARLDEVLHSRSWRATAPLRAAGRLASRARASIRILVAGAMPAVRERERVIRASGLFDAGYYCRRHRLVPPWSENPLRHFALVGSRGGLSPNPLFDVAWYRANSSLRGRPEADPFAFYLAATAAEDRHPHPLFDGAYYLETNPDLAATGVEPLGHYLSQGWREGRDPHPLFHTSYYLDDNPDVAGSGVNPLVHFLLHGGFEGRSPHPEFDAAFYLDAYPDVREAGVNPLVHYVTVGRADGRDPSPAARAVRLAPPPAPDVPPEPALAPDDPHRLFDAAFYLERNPDVREAGKDPVEHYLGNGWKESRDPHPLFSTDFYLEASRGIRPENENPLTHFLREGGAAGLSPHPLFDAAAYLSESPDVRAAGMNPLLHYLEQGAAEGRRPNAFFDGAFYGSFYDDVGGENPLVHYARTGMAEGRHTRRETWTSEEWRGDYVQLGTMLAAERRRRIESFRPTPLGLPRLEDGQVACAAATLRFPATEEPVVSIVVPVYNQVRLTVECLLSLRASGDSVPCEVIVADDGSSDGTREVVGTIPGIRYLRSDENRGFLRNCNAAAREARGGFLLFLNNDVQVATGFLDALVATFRERPDAGAVGPRVLFPDGRLQEAGARIFPDGTTKFVGVFEDPEQPLVSGVRRVDYCSGVCLLVRRSDFERLGGFDDALAPSYCEDVDLCLRLQEAGLAVYCNPASTVVHHLSETTRLLPDDYKLQCVARNRQKVVGRHWETIRGLNDVRLVAFYLPQFHPIPENDLWWGKGFTEWRNVVRGRPNFEGHLQPHLPADLGFYDLRVEETVREQWRLARRYGISAFCYHYYWFAGKRLLESPLEKMLAMSGPKLPFCLSWANENWTRSWDGGSEEILLDQRHDAEDDRAMIRDVIRYFREPDYLHVDGRPLFVVYRHDLFPDVAETIRIWREECARAGVPNPYLVASEAVGLAFRDEDPRVFGFDAAMEFPPHGADTAVRPPGRILNPAFRGRVFDYRATAAKFASRPAPGYPRFRGIFPGWDNTARRQDSGHVFAFSSPGTYRAWLEEIAERTREEHFGDERLIFVNAWNEWAEGCHLEPDAAYGHAFLEATRDALLRK